MPLDGRFVAYAAECGRLQVKTAHQGVVSLGYDTLDERHLGVHAYTSSGRLVSRVARLPCSGNARLGLAEALPTERDDRPSDAIVYVASDDQLDTFLVTGDQGDGTLALRQSGRQGIPLNRTLLDVVRRADDEASALIALVEGFSKTATLVLYEANERGVVRKSKEEIARLSGSRTAAIHSLHLDDEGTRLTVVYRDSPYLVEVYHKP